MLQVLVYEVLINIIVIGRRVGGRCNAAVKDMRFFILKNVLIVFGVESSLSLLYNVTSILLLLYHFFENMVEVDCVPGEYN